MIVMPDSPKRGRPPKSVGEKLSTAIHIKLTAAQREAIYKAADGEPTAWARDVLLRAAKRKIG
jgi:hypothetical protein